MADESYLYAAFVSYRHVEPDSAVARWLHKALERYRTPKAARTELKIPELIGSVFLDDEELSASPNLSASIDSALQQSRYLIVICSPRTPESQWIDAEVRRFRALGREDRILPVLIEGEPEESFPPALASLLAAPSGRPVDLSKRTDPLAADLRRRPRLLASWARHPGTLKLLAPMLGCKYADLARRDEAYQASQLRQLAAVCLLVAAVIAGLTWTWFKASRASTSGEIAASALRLKDSQLDLASLLAIESMRTADTFEARNAMLLLLQTSPQLVSFVHLEAPVTAVDFGPGSLLAAGLENGTIHIIDSATRRVTGTSLHGHTGQINRLAFTPDGATLASVSSDDTLRVWDVQGRRTRRDPVDALFGGDIAISADGRTAAWPAREEVRLEPLFPQGPRQVLTVDSRRFFERVAFGRANSFFATDERGVVRRWNLPATESVAEALTQCCGDFALALTRGAPELLAATIGNNVGVFRLPNLTKIGELEGHTQRILNMDFSPDGRLLASASVDDSVWLWDTTTLRGAPLVTGLPKMPRDVAFSGDGTVLATAGGDARVRLWRHADNPLETRFNDVDENVRAVAFSRDGTVFASDVGGWLQFWNPGTGRPLRERQASHDERIARIQFSDDGTVVLTVADDDRARLWDTASQRQLGRTFGARAAALSSDGRRLAVADDDDLEICQWQRENEECTSLDGHERPVTDVAFNASGTLLASAARDGIRIWNASTGTQLHHLSGLPDDGRRLRFGPSDLLVSGENDGSLWLWDARQGERLGEPLTGHTLMVTDIAVSPDGSTLATSSRDGTIRLWDLKRRQAIGGPLAHGGDVWSLAFNPNGKQLITGSTHGLWSWDVDPGSWLDRLCRKANRTLSAEEWDRYVDDRWREPLSCGGALPRTPAPQQPEIGR